MTVTQVLRRALTPHPRGAWPTCTRCGHGWHGLECKAAACHCPTAFEENQ